MAIQSFALNRFEIQYHGKVSVREGFLFVARAFTMPSRQCPLYYSASRPDHGGTVIRVQYIYLRTYWPSQCNFDMEFAYILAGWEGLAHGRKGRVRPIKGARQWLPRLHSKCLFRTTSYHGPAAREHSRGYKPLCQVQRTRILGRQSKRLELLSLI
jgi:hypothetical protein